MIKIGQLLKGFRTSDEFDITLTELSNITGISQPFLSMIENGKKKLTPKTFLKIVEGLSTKGKLSTKQDLNPGDEWDVFYFIEYILLGIREEIAYIDSTDNWHPIENLSENDISILNLINDYLTVDNQINELPSEYLNNSISTIEKPGNINVLSAIVDYDLDLKFMATPEDKSKINLYLDGTLLTKIELTHLENTIQGIRYNRSTN